MYNTVITLSIHFDKVKIRELIILLYFEADKNISVSSIFKIIW